MDAANSEKIVRINGTHQYGNQSINVQGLTVQNNRLTYMPVNIAEFFPNIIFLDFSLNEISFVNITHIRQFPHLLRINLNTNKITQLDSNLFAASHSIKFINFSGNKIKHVGHDLILPNSGQIFFNANACINEQAVDLDQIAILRFKLLLQCPPTISQIENTLESRPNLITKLNSQVERLQTETDKLDHRQLEIIAGFENLAKMVESICKQFEDVLTVVDNLKSSVSELDMEVQTMNEVVGKVTSKVNGLVEENERIYQIQMEMRSDVINLGNRIAVIRNQGQILSARTDALENGLSDTNVIVETHSDLLKSVRSKNWKLEKRVEILESIIDVKLPIT
ncbi:hypothetical protein Bhyg_17574 [Pseudolycoriella hygida]|uniref:Uncharacterized protein n=1 Tax=Pseudolycoriella hygida TaxID=35572 RepID=A0A9Q0MJ72_9DIPT|nr:hypothetical protein Bhyg_17574 [Pseudolycoriella hygida]